MDPLKSKIDSYLNDKSKSIENLLGSTIDQS